MQRVEIELRRDYAGAGVKGDIVAVGAERADRWCREGIAVLHGGKSAWKPKEPEPKPEQSEPEPEPENSQRRKTRKG